MISLGQFRHEISAYGDFHLVYDAPLDPFTLNLRFNHVAVNLGVNSYIAFRDGASAMCLSHIAKIIKKYKREADGSQKYIILCNDFKRIDEPAPVEITLFCN